MNIEITKSETQDKRKLSQLIRICFTETLNNQTSSRTIHLTPNELKTLNKKINEFFENQKNSLVP